MSESRGMRADYDPVPVKELVDRLRSQEGYGGAWAYMQQAADLIEELTATNADLRRQLTRQMIKGSEKP